MVHLDHAAATPLEAAAIDAMIQASRAAWGNPDSAHREGRRARLALETAAVEVAEYLGCAAFELRLCASASEGLCAALGFAMARHDGPIVGTRIEHACIDAVLCDAADAGREVRWIDTPAGDLPGPDPSQCEDAAVVVLCALNHELGTAPDLRPWIDAAPRAAFVIDAVQAAAWLDLAPLFVERAFVVVGSRKLGGPDGAAAIRCPAADLTQWDRNVPRSRVAVPAAAGFGAACAARRGGRADALVRARELGVQLRNALLAVAPSVHDDSGRSWLGPIVNVAVRDADSTELEALLDLHGVAVARMSACRRAVDARSRVVAHAHPDEPWRAASCLRFSLGWSSTPDDVVAGVAAFASILAARHGELPG